MFKAYSKEWELGKKGTWIWDDTETQPILLNAVDITAEERAAAALAAEVRNGRKYDYTQEETQDLVFQEANKVAEQLVEDTAVLDSDIHILVIVARNDTGGGTGES
jgi:hypothetical protein